MERRKKGLKIVAVFLCVALIGLTLAAVNQWEQQEDPADSPAPQEGTQRHKESILVMGLDKYQAPEDYQGYFNDQQSDFMMVMILDWDNRTCDLLHLNRDTMTEIQRLGIGGGVADTFVGQLTLAHTFGSGGSDSCFNAKQAVSHLLNDTPIDHYVSVTMEAVEILNDLAGGVTLEVMDDFSGVDSTLVKGEHVTLMGAHTMNYIRSRSGLADSTNLHRMERQRQYIGALFDQLQKKNREDPDFLEHTLMEINPYMQSDYTIYQLSDLGEKLGDFTRNPIVTIPGKAVKGAGFMEFYPDQEAIKKIIDTLFDPVG